MSAKTGKNTNNPQVANLYPRLKQRQRVLHTLKALLRLLKLAIFFAFLYGFYLLWGLDFWKIKTVEINGAGTYGYSYTSRFDLEKSFRGRHLLEVNPQKVKDSLQNIRLFKDISVNRSLFPATLQINVSERKPYLKIFEEASGKDVIIDEEGVMLTFYSDKKVNPLSVYFIKKINKFRLTNEQLNVIKVIENFRKTNKIKDLGKYDITNPKNILLATQDNLVMLGNLDNLVMKLETVPGLESLSKNNKNELEYIDVRYWKNPVLKIKKGSGFYEKKR